MPCTTPPASCSTSVAVDPGPVRDRLPRRDRRGDLLACGPCRRPPRRRRPAPRDLVALPRLVDPEHRPGPDRRLLRRPRAASGSSRRRAAGARPAPLRPAGLAGVALGGPASWTRPCGTVLDVEAVFPGDLALWRCWRGRRDHRRPDSAHRFGSVVAVLAPMQYLGQHRASRSTSGTAGAPAGAGRRPPRGAAGGPRLVVAPTSWPWPPRPGTLVEVPLAGPPGGGRLVDHRRPWSPCAGCVLVLAWYVVTVARATPSGWSATPITWARWRPARLRRRGARRRRDPAGGVGLRGLGGGRDDLHRRARRARARALHVRARPGHRTRGLSSSSATSTAAVPPWSPRPPGSGAGGSDADPARRPGVDYVGSRTSARPTGSTWKPAGPRGARAGRAALVVAQATHNVRLGRTEATPPGMVEGVGPARRRRRPRDGRAGQPALRRRAAELRRQRRPRRAECDVAPERGSTLGAACPGRIPVRWSWCSTWPTASACPPCARRSRGSPSTSTTTT